MLNVVFDLGGVVFDWQPDSVIRGIFTDPGTQKLVREEIVDHHDWIELDRGTLSQEEQGRVLEQVDRHSREVTILIQLAKLLRE